MIRSWLNRLFGKAHNEKIVGISINLENAWEVSKPKKSAEFLRHLPELVPEGSVLYFESTGFPKDIQEYLAQRPAEHPAEIPTGTLWPRPKIFHMPLTNENMLGLAEKFEMHREPVNCGHLHVYLENSVLLEGYDFPDWFLVAAEISEDNLRNFCETIGCTFKRYTR